MTPDYVVRRDTKCGKLVTETRKRGKKRAIKYEEN